MRECLYNITCKLQILLQVCTVIATFCNVLGAAEVNVDGVTEWLDSLADFEHERWGVAAELDDKVGLVIGGVIPFVGLGVAF